MHEGDHSILEEEHDHGHHEHKAETTPTAFGPRMIAAIAVGVAVVVFLIWRFM